jgi:type I restriction enzyme S subunit
MIKRLGDICTFVGGGTPSKKNPDFFNGSIPWATVRDMNVRVIKTTEHSITPDAVQQSATNIIPQGEVVISTHVGLGKVCFLGQDTAINQDLKAVIPNGELSRRYLYYWFISKTDELIANGKGATVKGVTLDFVKNLKIQVMPEREQEAVSDTLDKVHNVIELADAQVSRLNQLVKSRFVEMFGDVTVNDRGWETATLPELGELNRGVSKARPRNSPELLGGPYPLVQTGDVSNSGLWIKNYSSTYSDKGLAQSRLWKRGTLCITIAANIAQTAILNFDACFPDSVVGFVPNERTDAIFIHYWFSFFQKILEAQAPQVAQKNINLRILSGLKVVEPPLALQREFAAFVAKVDKLAFAVRRRRDVARQMYRAKIQEFFG